MFIGRPIANQGAGSKQTIDLNPVVTQGKKRDALPEYADLAVATGSFFAKELPVAASGAGCE